MTTKVCTSNELANVQQKRRPVSLDLHQKQKQSPALREDSPSRGTPRDEDAMHALTEGFASSLRSFAGDEMPTGSLGLKQMERKAEQQQQQRPRSFHLHAEPHGTPLAGCLPPVSPSTDSCQDLQHLDLSPGKSSDTPSLSSESRSESEDSMLSDHLPHLYSDLAISNSANSSTHTLTPMDSPVLQDCPQLPSYGFPPPTVQRSVAASSSTSASEGASAGLGAHEEDEDSKMLSFPLKVCAYALALLPIPTSILTSHNSASSPPPLPVEHQHSPRTCRFEPCLLFLLSLMA